jgi:transcriptional regulator with XRE-family HTH domain
VAEKTYFPNLSKTRLLRGYTQKDMTAILGHKWPSRYAQYETGDRKPHVREAIRIANVLGETVEFLFAEAKETPAEG